MTSSCPANVTYRRAVSSTANPLVGTVVQAFGPNPPRAIAAHQAVLVLAVYFVGLIVVAAGLLRLTDVSQAPFRPDVGRAVGAAPVGR